MPCPAVGGQGQKGAAMPAVSPRDMPLTDACYPALRRCPLFAGLPDASLSRALSLLSAVGRTYARGEYLCRQDEFLSRFGLVLAGTVQVYTDDLEGNQMMMANVTQGETFGESLCFLQRKAAHLYIMTAAGAEVLWLDASFFHTADGADPLVYTLFSRFTAMLAARTLEMNERIQILSKRTLREKLLTFFAGWERRSGQKTFSVPFDRASLAVYLGVNRTALSRELSLMQREGLIDFYRNSFRIFI